MTSDGSCWGCGSPYTVAQELDGYLRCTACGLRTTAVPRESGVLDNGICELSVVQSLDSLTASQVKVSVNAAVRYGSLLDIGSGTGKFLFHVRDFFTKVIGLELSPASVQFAKDTLRLSVVSDIDATTGTFDVITAWHTLEHIPSDALLLLAGGLRLRSHPDTRLVICVPNPDSILARLCRDHWAFRDTGSHLHEFSRRSLDALFARYGFKPVRAQKMWIYTLFAWVQSLCNIVIKPHNYMYYRLKRGRDYFANKWLQVGMDCCAAAVVCGVLPVGFACAALEHVLLSQTSVHVVTYAPHPSTDDRQPASANATGTVAWSYL